MLKCRMPQKTKTSVTEEQWLEAVAAFELGTHHANELAADLGVSPATVSREFKRRSARKACRVAEVVADLEASLDAKARQRARQRATDEAAALERSAAFDVLIGGMMKSLVAAERAGSLSSAARKVNDVGRALGVRGLG